MTNVYLHEWRFHSKFEKWRNHKNWKKRQAWNIRQNEQRQPLKIGKWWSLTIKNSLGKYRIFTLNFFEACLFKVEMDVVTPYSSHIPSIFTRKTTDFSICKKALDFMDITIYRPSRCFMKNEHFRPVLFKGLKYVENCWQLQKKVPFCIIHPSISLFSVRGTIRATIDLPNSWPYFTQKLL